MSSHNFNRPLVDAAADELVSHGTSSDDEARHGSQELCGVVTVISVGRAVTRHENRRQTDVVLRRKAMHINATAVDIDEPVGKGRGGSDDTAGDGGVARALPKIGLACLVVVILGGLAVAALWYFDVLTL
jgi:hypothetical protein